MYTTFGSFPLWQSDIAEPSISLGEQHTFADSESLGDEEEAKEMKMAKNKVAGWDESGKGLATAVMIHTQMRKVLEGLGLGPEAIDWALSPQGMAATTGTVFAAAMETMAHDFQEHCIVSRWHSPMSVTINTALSPLLPYPDVSNLVNHGASLELDIDGNGLHANGKLIHLHMVELSADHRTAPTIDDVLPRNQQDHALEGLNINLAFFLRRHPKFVPLSWKEPTSDGFTPHIVLPGTRYKFEHRNVVAAMSWDEREEAMTNSWTEIGAKLSGPHPITSWHPVTGLKPRNRIYIARLWPD